MYAAFFNFNVLYKFDKLFYVYLFIYCLIIMHRLLQRFQDKNLIFDFIFLFTLLTVVSFTFLILTYIAFKKPLFDASDLNLLRTPEKLIMFILIIPFVEEFSTRGVFALSNKITISLFTILFVTV